MTISQFRILIDYLYFILFPTLSDSGIFHDDYSKSINLLSPISTLYSLIVIIFLLCSAFISRKTFPLYSLAIFWFFTGHLIESTIIPLELYFEHRNYLPSLGLFWIIAYLFISLWNKHKVLTTLLASVYLALLLIISGINSNIYSSKENIALSWGTYKKNSPRAQHALAWHWISQKEPAQAMKVLNDSIQAKPRNIYLQLVHLFYQCQLNNDSPEIISQLIQSIPKGKLHIAINTPVIQTLEQFLKGKCHSLNGQNFSQILQLLINHPGSQDIRIKTDLYYALSLVKSTERDLNGAMTYMDKSIEYFPRIKLLLLQARWLSSAGLFDDADRYIKKARKYMYSLNKMEYKKIIDKVESLINTQKEQTTAISIDK